jgi:hypothetical protein
MVGTRRHVGGQPHYDLSVILSRYVDSRDEGTPGNRSATGVTSYDDDVARFFSPYAADESAIFMMALGKSKDKAAHQGKSIQD